MRCNVRRSRLSGSIRCPPNKSYTHRAIFLGSLSGNSAIKNPLYSSDTEATISSCAEFGATISREPDSLHVANPICVDSARTIDAANSGTTIRIAAGIAALFPHTTVLSGDSSLQKRPMGPMLDALESMGARCTSRDQRPPISVTGRMRGGNVSIRGDISSQFVSSLLMSAPLTDNGIRLHIDGDLVSKPYLDATIHTMSEFGIRTDTISPYREYDVSPQQYHSATFAVPSDYSSMALLLAASVLVGDTVTIRMSQGRMPQGDRVFVEMLRDMGADISAGADSVVVSEAKTLHGGSFDLSDTPDLLPPLSILALKSQDPLNIVNAQHARYKETDRISITCSQLQKLGVLAKERPDGMTLHAQQLRGADLDPQGDHRLFMAFCIAGMFVGGCTVRDADSVSVSYPDFIPQMRMLGARIT